MKVALSLVAFALVASSAGFASAQTEGRRSTSADGTCGVKLVLINPDLQTDSGGVIHASGWFFIQFQAIGDGAQNVKSFTFSFGKAIPDALVSCSGPRWVTGAYIQDYRGDYTPEDGFFVPINTTLVPDGDYAAAVHAYDASKNEIGRFWVNARVENGCQMARCQDRTADQLVKADKTLPWPRVLPGDGVQTNKDVNGLTVEFAESVTDVHAYVNGNETPLSPWPGVMMDDDFQPGNDNTPCGSQPSPVCVKRVWGPAFKWEGSIRQNDVIRVVATDLNGNRVEKIIHLLDPTQGGIVSGDKVDIDINVDDSTKTIGPGQTGSYVFQFTSLSSSDAHVNLPIEYDESQLEAHFTPDHVVVKGGERAKAELFVSPKVDSGTFLFKAKPTWRSEGTDVTKEFPLSLVVGSGQGGNLVSTSASNATSDVKKDEGKSPGPGFGVALGAVVAAVVVLGRRRVG